MHFIYSMVSKFITWVWSNKWIVDIRWLLTWWSKCKRKLFLDSFHLFCVMEAFMMLKRIQKMPEIEYWLLGIKENKRWAKQLHGSCVSRCESVYYLDKFLYVAKGVATINMFFPLKCYHMYNVFYAIKNNNDKFSFNVLHTRKYPFWYKFMQ